MKQLSFTLRDYQQEFVRNMAISVKRNTHIIGQSPGGTGKTKTFVYIGTQVCNKGGVTLVLTERKNVYEQNLHEAGAIGINADIKTVRVYPGGFYVAMTQTLEKRACIIQQFNTLTCDFQIIIDECHSGRYSNLLRKLTHGRRLGFTATPDFKQAKHLPEFYNDCVCTHPVQWFIDNGYLCDYQHIERVSGKGTNSLEKRNGEFTESAQRKFFGTEEHYLELFRDLSETPFNKCMLFCASIDHAEEVYDRMQKQGYSVSINHSKRNDSEYQVACFDKLHKTNIIISVGGMTTGYDYPDVDLIVLYRATTSLIIYLQMLFRADRPKEGMFFRCLDYGGNGTRHGAYFKNHDWAKKWNQKEKNKTHSDEISLQICPNCESMIFVAAKNCKFCGYELPKPKQELELGTAADITNRLSPLIGRRISTLSPRELALFANLKNKKPFAQRVAMALEHNCNGYLKDYAKYMGYKINWAYIQKDRIGDSKIDFADIIIS